MQIGGYDGEGHIDDDLSWVPLLSTSKDFYVGLQGMMMND